MNWKPSQMEVWTGLFRDINVDFKSLDEDALG